MIYYLQTKISDIVMSINYNNESNQFLVILYINIKCIQNILFQ